MNFIKRVLNHFKLVEGVDVPLKKDEETTPKVLDISEPVITMISLLRSGDSSISVTKGKDRSSVSFGNGKSFVYIIDIFFDGSQIRVDFPDFFTFDERKEVISALRCYLRLKEIKENDVQRQQWFESFKENK